MCDYDPAPACLFLANARKKQNSDDTRDSSCLSRETEIHEAQSCSMRIFLRGKQNNLKCIDEDVFYRSGGESTVTTSHLT